MDRVKDPSGPIRPASKVCPLEADKQRARSLVCLRTAHPVSLYSSFCCCSTLHFPHRFTESLSGDGVCTGPVGVISSTAHDPSATGAESTVHMSPWDDLTVHSTLLNMHAGQLARANLLQLFTVKIQSTGSGSSVAWEVHHFISFHQLCPAHPPLPPPPPPLWSRFP